MAEVRGEEGRLVIEEARREEDCGGDQRATVREVEQWGQTVSC